MDTSCPPLVKVERSYGKRLVQMALSSLTDFRPGLFLAFTILNRKLTSPTGALPTSRAQTIIRDILVWTSVTSFGTSTKTPIPLPWTLSGQ